MKFRLLCDILQRFRYRAKYVLVWVSKLQMLVWLEYGLFLLPQICLPSRVITSTDVRLARYSDQT